MLFSAVGGMMETLHWPRGHLRGYRSIHAVCTCKNSINRRFKRGQRGDFFPPMLSLYLQNTVLSQSQSPSFYLQRLLMRSIVAFVADFTDMMVWEDWRCSGSEEHNSFKSCFTLLGSGYWEQEGSWDSNPWPSCTTTNQYCIHSILVLDVQCLVDLQWGLNIDICDSLEASPSTSARCECECGWLLVCLFPLCPAMIQGPLRLLW